MVNVDTLNTEFLNYVSVRGLELFEKELTIDNVGVITFTNGDREQKKLVLDFEEIEFKLVLNVTNKNILRDKYGPETDNWIGEKITMIPVKREFKGQLVNAIQLKS